MLYMRDQVNNSRNPNLLNSSQMMGNVHESFFFFLILTTKAVKKIQRDNFLKFGSHLHSKQSCQF